MPRQARIDIPGHLYHVMARGIERRRIFIDQRDYEDFLSRLEKVLKKTGSKCFAFTLLKNHFHLLIMRGERPLAEMMRRLMTGYAVNFNLRHRRVGHLFQNRYKAVLCDGDGYFLELVAYIHLNPLRAGLVEDLKGLRSYKWCGHNAFVRKNVDTFMAKEEVLGQFGKHLREAIKGYESYLAERANKFRRGELSGGGLMRSMGSCVLRGLSTEGRNEVFDERVLGDGDFVASVWREAEEEPVGKVSPEELVKQVIMGTNIRPEDLFSRSQVRQVVKARALYCYLAKERGRMNGGQLMRQLRLTSGAISHLVNRGRELYEANKI